MHICTVGSTEAHLRDVLDGFCARRLDPGLW
jgi:hypothetical protein